MSVAEQETAADTGARPKRRRLVGVDATRGLALLGMMAVHVLPPTDPDGTVSTSYQLTGGRAAATFAVLAGAGLALASGGQNQRATNGFAASVAVRALAIGAIGLILGYAESGLAVILTYYAMFFLLSIPLLRLPPRVLGIIAIAIAIVVPVLSHLIRPGFPSPDRGNPTFDSLLADPFRLLSELLLTGYYPALAWMTYLAAGLAVGRLNLRSTKVAAGLLAGGTALAAIAAAGSWLLLDVFGGRQILAATGRLGTTATQVETELSTSFYGTTPPTDWWWLAIDAPHSSTPFDLLLTTGIAVAVLGAVLLLARVVAPLLVPLAAAGAMTLTLYSAHVLLVSTSLLPRDRLTSYAIQAIGALVLATLWRLTRRRGPLEAAVAALATRTKRAVDR